MKVKQEGWGKHVSISVSERSGFFSSNKHINF
jgi:hypothetical protein